MNDTGEFLDRFAQAIADNVTATVVALNDDDTYMVRTIGSRALERASNASAVDQFTIGERVLLSRPSASRNAIGSTAAIISRAQREQRGLSATVPAEVRETAAAAAVTSTTPDPLTLQAGGAAADHVITGSGFTGPATYYAPGSGPDPVLIEAAPPEVSAREVTMHVQADPDSPLGTFDMEIAGVRVRDALRVVRPRIYGLLFVPGAHVYGVDPERGRIFRQSDLLPVSTNRVFTIAPDTVIAFRAAGGATILNRELEQLVHYGSTIVPAVNEFSQMAHDEHGAIWYCSGNTLYRVTLETGIATPIHTAAGAYEGVAYDRSGDRVFACSRDVRTVRAYARGSGALTSTIVMPGSGSTTPFVPRNLVIENGTHLVVYGQRPVSSGTNSTSQTTTRVELSTLSIVEALTLSGTGAPVFPIGYLFNARNQNMLVVRRAATSGTYRPADDGTSRVGTGFAGSGVINTFFAAAKFMAAGFLNHDQQLVSVGQSADGTQLQLSRWDISNTELTEENTAVLVDPAVPNVPSPSGYLRI